MDSTFTEFIAKAKRLGLCQEYTDKVDKAGSKLAFMQIALDANAMPWLCESICKGWGLTPEYIAQKFAPFNNGRFIRNDGYTSAMFCLPPEDEIKIDTTATLIIGFNGKIKVDRPCEIYLCNSQVVIIGNGAPRCYLYNSSVVNPDGIATIESQKDYASQD